MIPFSHSNTREEDLRRWAGRLLVGAGQRRDAPVEDDALVREFLLTHGVGPILATAPGNELPREWLHDDDHPDHLAVAAEMARKNEFVTVIKALQNAPGPDPIIFKGQALAYNTYPRPWLRPRCDIDALIEPDSFQPMVDVLRGLGYSPTDAIDANLILPQTSLSKKRHGVTHVWDVHRAISNRPVMANVLPYRELRDAAVAASVDGASFLAPDRVDSLLIACLHLIGHHGSDLRLIWLYDIHLLVDSLSDPQRRQFLHKAATRPEVQSCCHAALNLTQRYLPASRTDDLRCSLDPGAGRRWSSRTYLVRLIQDARAVQKQNRPRFVRQHVFPSPDYMMRRFAVRRRWHLPFWYVMRIGRAIPKLFRRR